LYRTTKVPRRRTRAQMILLAAEQGLKVPQIALITRESEATVPAGSNAIGLRVSKGYKMHHALGALRR
jgi:hypothetical protein